MRRAIGKYINYRIIKLGDFFYNALTLKMYNTT